MTEDFEPTTPVIGAHTKVSKHDPNEVLLDNSEISEDESAGDISNPLEDDFDDLAQSHDHTEYKTVEE